MASRQDEKDIVIYHIGGEGDYGPSMCIPSGCATT